MLLYAAKPPQVNWAKVTDSKEVVSLLKQRKKLEEKIRAIDKRALLNYELEVLQLNLTN